MSEVAVRHLNGDSTFLLTFSGTDQSPLPSGYNTNRGNFTVLFDPWLVGYSTIFHPKFAIAKHTVPSSISHLSQIDAPNVIIISQDKTDHCHEATLRQLDPELRHTLILAHPAAARKIRSWNYFEPTRIHTLPAYNAFKHDSLIRFNVPSTVPGGSPGEVTVAYIPAKRDITGLHNAIGITYRPPSAPFSFSSQRTPITFTSPNTPSTFYDGGSSHSAIDLPLRRSSFAESLPLTPPESPLSPSNYSRPPSSSIDTSFFTNSNTSSISTALSTQSIYQMHTPFRPKTMSVLYSPHGVTYNHILPYVHNHLIGNAALPLSLLLHSFDRVQNTWYLGGNITAGMPGGIEIARNLLAKHWISAHDEDKENSGFAVLKIQTRKYSVEEIRSLLLSERKGGRVSIDVRALDCGEQMIIST